MKFFYFGTKRDWKGIFHFCDFKGICAIFEILGVILWFHESFGVKKMLFKKVCGVKDVNLLKVEGSKFNFLKN